MAKKKFTRKKSVSVSLAVIAGLAPGAMRIYEQAKAGGIGPALNTLTRVYTGFSPANYGFGQGEAAGTWNPALLRLGLMPLAVGIGIHKLASRFGINRAIRQAGIPFIGI